MFPIFDFEDGKMVVKPVLQIVFEQLYDSGVREFCFVVGRGKRAIEDYFTPDWNFVEELEKAGKQVQAKSLRRFYSKIEDGSIVYVNQPRPLGFGHAVLTARSVVDDDFIVAGGDTYLADPAPLRELAAPGRTWRRRGGTASATRPRRRPWPISSPTGELGASCPRGCSRGSPASRLRRVSKGPLCC
jgi:NDP-sugar pyrophosphorylase family protein